ncbi:MAG TPA: ABC transporter permease [Thermoanaerobaculia bacterium]|jgi:ABC-2 type transport system permease protein
MNFRRVKAVARKELTHVLRDPRSLATGIAIPMVLIILFGYALTLDVDDVPFAVWDRSGTPRSRELVAAMDASQYLRLERTAHSYRELELAIERGDVLAAIVIPHDVNRGAALQLILDGSDANTASIAAGYIENVVQRFGCPQCQPNVDLRPRVWFNPDMVSRNYIVPGLLAVIMNVIAALLTSLTVAREWETGTMEQLISTPLRVPELIVGKLVPYWLIGMVDVVLAFLVGRLLFDVPFRGNLWLLFGTTAVFLIGVLTFGVLISVVTKSQLLANQLAVLGTYLPAFLLSGFMYSIENMPRPLQLITYILPARYYVTLLKGLFLKGTGLEVLWIEIVFLVAYTALVMLVANVKLKKKLEA